MEKIPEIVMQKAFSEGFNQVNYLGLHEGAAAYAVGSLDPDGHPLPTGLPTIILLKDGRTEMICGEEGLELLGKFL